MDGAGSGIRAWVYLGEDASSPSMEGGHMEAQPQEDPRESGQQFALNPQAQKLWRWKKTGGPRGRSAPREANQIVTNKAK